MPARRGDASPLLDLVPLLAQAPFLRTVGDSLPVGIFAADVHGRLLYANRRFAELCGASGDDIERGAWLHAVHPDERARVEAEWTRAVHESSEWQTEFRCDPRLGAATAVSVRSAPLLDEQGAVFAHVGYAEDISLRTRLQTKLATLIEASRMLLGTPRLDAVFPATLALAKNLIAADAYAVWRLHEQHDWRIVISEGISDRFASSVIQTYRGRAVSPMPFATAMPVEDVGTSSLLSERRPFFEAEGIRSVLIAPLNIGGTVSGSLVFYYRSPQRFDRIRVETASALGNLAAVAIAIAELYEEQVRQRSRAERAYQQSAFLAAVGMALGTSLDYEATLRAVAELAVPRIADWCAVDIVDADGRVKRLAVAHVDPKKVEFARSFAERYPVDPESPYSMHQVIRTGRSVMLSEVRDEVLVAAARNEEHLKALRQLGITSFIIVPLIANGRTLGAMTFVTAESTRPYTSDDLRFAEAVAERAALAVDNARAYSEARAANRAKDEFLATLSHELRTPINAIMGWAQMLQQRIVHPNQTSRAVDAIVRNAAAQARLIDDLLDLSRIISGKLRLEMELVDIGAIVGAALSTIEPAAQAKGLRLQILMDQGNGRVYGDRQRLQQAVWNLLANAVKFTERGGHIEVRVQHVGSHIEIVVRDTGEGIPREVLPFIFDRFRQGDTGSTRQHAGLGLGLAIVRHIVELHGGSVQATSDGPGTGATFRVKLPFSVAQTPLPVEPTPVPQRPTPDSLEVAALPDLKGTRVLVVEDEPDAREMVAYLLRTRNADVSVAGSVDEALRAIDACVPDVLLSDIEMPERDGYELIVAVRSRAPAAGGEIPAAALTAYSRAEDRARAILAGFDAHLPKPVDLAELIATVDRLRSRHLRPGGQP